MIPIKGIWGVPNLRDIPVYSRLKTGFRRLAHRNAVLAWFRFLWNRHGYKWWNSQESSNLIVKSLACACSLNMIQNFMEDCQDCSHVALTPCIEFASTNAGAWAGSHASCLHLASYVRWLGDLPLHMPHFNVRHFQTEICDKKLNLWPRWLGCLKMLQADSVEPPPFFGLSFHTPVLPWHPTAPRLLRPLLQWRLALKAQELQRFIWLTMQIAVVRVIWSVSATPSSPPLGSFLHGNIRYIMI